MNCPYRLCEKVMDSDMKGVIYFLTNIWKINLLYKYIKNIRKEVLRCSIIVRSTKEFC